MSQARITELLEAMDRGEPAAAEELLPLVYAELKSRAARLLAGERAGHTLQRTALVHEAYLRLAGANARYESKLHFMNAAALAMRRILLDHADAKATQKRGGKRARVNLDHVDAAADDESDLLDWMALEEALAALKEVSPRQAQVVNLRFFAGCTEDEIAEMLRISIPTVRRDWATARPWLRRHMNKRDAEPE